MTLGGALDRRLRPGCRMIEDDLAQSAAKGVMTRLEPFDLRSDQDALS
jgi:hypothetical protein